MSKGQEIKILGAKHENFSQLQKSLLDLHYGQVAHCVQY